MGRNGPRVLQAVTPTNSKKAPYRGLQRHERNMLRAITGDFGKLDRNTLSTLRKVLG